MFTQELITFDKKELSPKSLFYNKLSFRLKFLVGILFLLIGVSLFLALYFRFYLLKLLFLILMPGCLYGILHLSQKALIPILKRHLHEAYLDSPNIWNDRNLLIHKIQYHKLSEFITSQNFKSASKILFLIELLKSESNKPRYKFQFLSVFLTLSSVLIAAIFAAITIVPQIFKSALDVIFFFKPIVGFFLLFILFFWFGEVMLIRNLFEMRNSKYGRLIRLLEDYYLNEFQHKE